MSDKMNYIEVTALDVRIMVSVLICFFTAVVLEHLNIKFPWGEMRLEIVQKMTACISCLLCCQDTAELSRKAGIHRIIITLIGGLMGIVVVLIDQAVGNGWMMTVIIPLGVLATLVLCKAAKVPYVNARIGGVTFLLVACTLKGTARICYAVFRLLSTLYGAAVVYLVTLIMQRKREK